MRYRIVLEVDTNEKRDSINRLAQHLYDEAVTTWTTPVFLSTEVVENRSRTVIRETY